MEATTIIQILTGVIITIFGWILRNFNERLNEKENSASALNDAKNKTLEVSIKNIELYLSNLNVKMSSFEKNYVTTVRFEDFQKNCELNQGRRSTD